MSLLGQKHCPLCRQRVSLFTGERFGPVVVCFKCLPKAKRALKTAAMVGARMLGRVVEERHPEAFGSARALFTIAREIHETHAREEHE